MDDALLPKGECDVCGLPGIVGMSCRDSDCYGNVVSLTPPKPTDAGIDGVDLDDLDITDNDGRYDKRLLDSVDDDKVISLDDLERQEQDEESSEDNSYDDTDQ